MVPRLIERYCKDGSRLSRDGTYRDGTEMVQRSNSEMVQKCSKYCMFQREFKGGSQTFQKCFKGGSLVFRTVQRWNCSEVAEKGIDYSMVQKY